MNFSQPALSAFRLAIIALITLQLPCHSRTITDFNFDWEFSLGVKPSPLEKPNEMAWKRVRLPHDWSIEEGFTKDHTGCSTGFLPCGVGWYRKTFPAPESWKGRNLSLVFEGVYCRSEVWLNGKKIGGRPSGYVSFVTDLTKALRFDGENTLIVKVDHSAYLDSRWYTGSGIYRHVHLVETSPTHIPEWGVWVQTPSVSDKEATLKVITDINSDLEEKQTLELKIDIADHEGKIVSTTTNSAEITKSGKIETTIQIQQPQLWHLESPHLYTAKTSLQKKGTTIDSYSTRFGIRNSRFDSYQGFLLNGQRIKIKGVNLHHDAGLVGAAVPRDVWRDRLERLQSVGCNAIRLSHNPHSSELLDLCDELGILVMNEIFDEWKIPKKKSLVFLSDNKAPKETTRGYTELFDEWAERDLKATIQRDRNHPSVIMWSIGNEIEWTYNYYPKSANYVPHAPNQDLSKNPPNYDPAAILDRMAKSHEGPDELYATAKQLVAWVKSTDPTRPVTSGLVHPSVGYATGYAKMLDVVGFNYRPWEYDGAHAMYPTWPIVGSENLGTRYEWEEANKRDFVAGIFIWTGYAYLGEAGPWPRKGLEISLFDYIGTKTPRGHLFEAMWIERPKVWLGTTPAETSEHKLREDGTWFFEQRTYEPAAMKWLRRWEWDFIEHRWNYEPGTSLVAQAYSNCEELELFLNGKSQGRLLMADIPDRIGKWMVPFTAGELKVVGYNDGKEVSSDLLQTSDELTAVQIKADRKTVRPNSYDVVRIDLQLQDKNGVSVVNDDRQVEFEITGPARILGVDNGSEKSVQPYKANQLKTWQGRALLLLQATDEPGEISIIAKSEGLRSSPVTVSVK